MVSKSALGIGLATLLSCADADANASGTTNTLEQITLVCNEGDEGRLVCYEQDTRSESQRSNDDHDLLPALYVCLGVFAAIYLVMTYYKVKTFEQYAKKREELQQHSYDKMQGGNEDD